MSNNIFEDIKKTNEFDQEYWSARDLYKLLGYTEYNKFVPAINRAIEACNNSKQKISEHFAQVSDILTIAIESNRKINRNISDYKLSRYACYLIAQNGDPRKEEIAKAQTYFAIQARRQEIRESQIEDNKRIYLRNEVKEHNKNLFSTARKSGVVNFATFQDFGYIGLYGGLRQKDIHQKKRLKKSQSILDHMGSEELAANLFRATQADAKLKRENIFGQLNANQSHLAVGKKVRQTIKELGGVMPENLPSVDDIKNSTKRLLNPNQDKLI
ncbi:MAG: DNA damage-inducible protein D [Candidatus Shapirobacteria bacterium]